MRSVKWMGDDRKGWSQTHVQFDEKTLCGKSLANRYALVTGNPVFGPMRPTCGGCKRRYASLAAQMEDAVCALLDEQVRMQVALRREKEVSRG